jgi:uncharacterized membrane protein
MWCDEVERIGKQRCTPAGYVLQGIGELVGFAGLLMLLASPVYLAFQVVVGTFDWRLLSLPVFAVGFGIVGSTTVAFSWSLAYRKQFRYDYERRVSSWIERGQKRTFTHADWQAEQVQRPR